MSHKILRHFKNVDPILFAAAEKVWPVKLKWRKADDFFAALCSAIVGQQLSDKVAGVLYDRLRKLAKGKLTPAIILTLSDQALRDTGMSWSKVRFIKELARAVTDKKIDLNGLRQLDDKTVMTELIKLKGIGSWTAEMFLMFSLGREDVFSYGDLGLRRAIKIVYGFKREPSKKTIERLTRRWAPYRTYACLVLWKIRD